MRRLRPNALSMIAAAMVLLPPSGWSLCIGTNGHFELEPAARDEQRCCEPQMPSGIADNCAPEDGSGCVDLALSPGLALRSEVEGLASAPLAAAPVSGLAFVFPHLSHLADPSAQVPAHPGGSRTGTIVLRC
ncbi:MAG: hypothetical protein ABIS67_03810 [Candidatus Eisenbacteria bacterium]